MKAIKCGVSGHVTKCTHPEDPNMAIFYHGRQRSKRKDLAVCDNYWMCNLGTIFRGMSIRKDLNTVLKNRERELGGGEGVFNGEVC